MRVPLPKPPSLPLHGCLRSFAAHIHPACLPMHGQTFRRNETCWITGFGKTKETDGEEARC